MRAGVNNREILLFSWLLLPSYGNEMKRPASTLAMSKRANQTDRGRIEMATGIFYRQGRNLSSSMNDECGAFHMGAR